MRHKIKGRTLSRTASHRLAMFRNMAASLIKTVRRELDDEGLIVPGRIVTTLPKAKELRPYIERLITLAKKALPHEAKAQEMVNPAERGSKEWKDWRKSQAGQKWATTRAPAVLARRRAMAALNDKEAVKILFEDLAPKFSDRQGGYTRIVRLAKPRLGDAGQRALIEFVGQRDRVSRRRTSAPMVVADSAVSTTPTTH